MNDDEIPTRFPSPWRPETDLLRLGLYGKLTEEIGELGAVIGRCVCRGIDADSDTRKRLEDEIADVRAVLTQVEFRLGLDSVRMRCRADAKVRFGSSWYRWLESGCIGSIEDYRL